MEDIQDIRVQANEHGVQGITTSTGEMTCKHVIIAAGLRVRVDETCESELACVVGKRRNSRRSVLS